MLAISLNASSPTQDYAKLPGRYVYQFWTAGKAISLATNVPFGRNSIVDIKRADGSAIQKPEGSELMNTFLDGDRVFLVEPVDLDLITERMVEKLGFLVPLATDIPLSPETKYSFGIEYGKAECLSYQRIDNEGFAYYQLLLLVKPNRCKVYGQDETYDDGGVSFMIDLTEEHAAFMEAYRTARRNM